MQDLVSNLLQKFPKYKSKKYQLDDSARSPNPSPPKTRPQKSTSPKPRQRKTRPPKSAEKPIFDVFEEKNLELSFKDDVTPIKNENEESEFTECQNKDQEKIADLSSVESVQEVSFESQKQSEAANVTEKSLFADIRES
jgi:hypothetical protein